MHRVFSVCLMAALAGCTAHFPANGDGSSYFFDCDTPAARYSEWRKEGIAEMKSVSGSLEFQETRSDEKWAPSAFVRIIGESSSREAGVFLSIQPGQSDRSEKKIDIAISTSKDQADRKVVGTYLSKGTAIPFAVTILEDEKVRFRVAETAYSIGAIEFRTKGISIGCSTANVKFKNVLIKYAP